jgi:hypothetical protein
LESEYDYCHDHQDFKGVLKKGDDGFFPVLGIEDVEVLVGLHCITDKVTYSDVQRGRNIRLLLIKRFNVWGATIKFD